MVYNDDPPGPDRADIFFTMSSNGGATWSAPVRVNDDVTTKDQWQPAISVSPDGRQLFIGFYDRRLDPARCLMDTFGVLGTVCSSGVGFGANFRISNESFPPVFGQDPVVSATYMGDYDTAVSDGSFFYYTWGDNRFPNAFHANQPDVRLAKIPIQVPGAILIGASTAFTDGNGNGVIDFNECISVDVTIRNCGSSNAGGVTARITSVTPGVSIAQGNSAYFDIPAGGTGKNLVPFRIATGSDFVCNTPITLTMIVDTATDGKFIVPFQLQANAANRFDNNTPVPIPDGSFGDSLITVSGVTAPITNLTVSLFLAHAAVINTTVQLIAPDGTSITLSNRRGGGLGLGVGCSPDSARLTFDDAASTAIGDATVFEGRFRPDQPLSAFNGKSGSAVNGTWRLRVNDLALGVAGTLECWSLFITACGDGGGQCFIEGTDLTGFWASLGRHFFTNEILGRFVLFNTGRQKNTSTTVQLWLSDNATLSGCDDVLLKQVTIGPLRRLRAKRVKADALPPAVLGSASGNFVIAVIDPDDIVSEGNEGDNVIVGGPLP